MEVVQSIGAPLDTGLRELRLQEAEKWSCMIDVVWASCHSHQPRHVAARQWHYSCGLAHHKLATDRTAFSQQWKSNGNY